MVFKTEKELVDWIDLMHLQNTNGRETHDEMFRLGIEAAIMELTAFNLFSIPVVVNSVACKHEEKTMQGDGFTYVICAKCGIDL